MKIIFIVHTFSTRKSSVFPADHENMAAVYQLLSTIVLCPNISTMTSMRSFPGPRLGVTPSTCPSGALWGNWPRFSHTWPSFSHIRPSFSHTWPRFSHIRPSFSQIRQSFSHTWPRFNHIWPSFSHIRPMTDKLAYRPVLMIRVGYEVLVPDGSVEAATVPWLRWSSPM